MSTRGPKGRAFFFQDTSRPNLRHFATFYSIMPNSMLRFATPQQATLRKLFPVNQHARPSF
jgi:hypothetical protein